MTALELIIITSILWTFICGAMTLLTYTRGYHDGLGDKRDNWDSTYKMWYAEGYYDGKEGRKKCVK